MTTLEELWGLVRTVPPGHVVAYSDLGRAMSRPVSGVLIGKWMTNCPADAPWWRVVGRTGELLVGRRDPRFAVEQRRLLESEGVKFDGDVVAPSFFWTP